MAEQPEEQLSFGEPFSGETLLGRTRGAQDVERKIGEEPPQVKEASRLEWNEAKRLAKRLGWEGRLVEATEIMGREEEAIHDFIVQAYEELDKRTEKGRQERLDIEWERRVEEREVARREQEKEGREAEERKRAKITPPKPTPTYITPSPLPQPVEAGGTYFTPSRRRQVGLSQMPIAKIQRKAQTKVGGSTLLSTMPIAQIQLSRQPTQMPSRQPSIWPSRQTTEFQEAPGRIEEALSPGEEIVEQVPYPVYVWIGPRRRWEQAVDAYIVSMGKDSYRFAAVDRTGTPRSKTIGKDISRAPVIAGKRGGR